MRELTLLAATALPCQANVTKAGEKLGLTIPLFQPGNVTRNVIRLTITNRTGQASFLALSAPWITIPASICTRLRIAYGETVSILELKTIQAHSRLPFKTQGENADLLSLIPTTSSNGYPPYVDEYENSGEPWLRIWYYHPRGAARQVELKRYVDIFKLGQLLGQLQAEGDKKSPRVAFKNASIREHADFVCALRALGVSSNQILARCVLNPTKSSHENARAYAASYSAATGVVISLFNENNGMKGGIVAETCVRSSILASILISAMDDIRKAAIVDERLRCAFLAKLLSGDGTLDARITPRRLDVRVKIVDQNVGYLTDYAEMLTREGFIPHVLPNQIAVRAYCTWLNLLTLYRISAFKNNANWTRLICAIIIQSRGAENQGYKRIQELSKCTSFTSADVSTRYSIGLRAANLWIGTIMRRNLMESLGKGDHGFKNYRICEKGIEIAGILEEVEREYSQICSGLGISEAEVILRRTKRKGAPRP